MRLWKHVSFLKSIIMKLWHWRSRRNLRDWLALFHAVAVPRGPGSPACAAQETQWGRGTHIHLPPTCLPHSRSSSALSVLPGVLGWRVLDNVLHRWDGWKSWERLSTCPRSPGYFAARLISKDADSWTRSCLEWARFVAKRGCEQAPWWSHHNSCHVKDRSQFVQWAVFAFSSNNKK